MTNAIITVEAHEVQTQKLFGGNFVERFIKFAGVKEKSAATYKTALKQLCKFFAANNIATPTREALEIWRDSLIAGTIDSEARVHFDGEVAADGRVYRHDKVNGKLYLVSENGGQELVGQKKTPSTIQLYVTSMKIFCRWLTQEGYLKVDISDNFKTKVKTDHDHKKDALADKQAGALIRNVSCILSKKTGKDGKVIEKHNTLKERRDRAIIALMVTAGLRCVEVYRADVKDFALDMGRVYLHIQGKGKDDKKAKVLVPSQVLSLIREYLIARGTLTANDNFPVAEGAAVGEESLFTSCANCNRGARLSTQSISKMVKANLRRAGLDTPRLTAHSLRATAATTMIMAGVDLTHVQQVLRHVNINTTMIYNKAVQRLKNTAEQTAANAIFDTISA